MQYLIRSRGGMRITRNAGLSVKVGNDFLRFNDLPAGIPEAGDGDYEVRRVEDDSGQYAEPEPYVRPVRLESAGSALVADGDPADPPKKRKSRMR